MTDHPSSSSHSPPQEHALPKPFPECLQSLKITHEEKVGKIPSRAIAILVVLSFRMPHINTDIMTVTAQAA